MNFQNEGELMDLKCMNYPLISVKFNNCFQIEAPRKMHLSSVGLVGGMIGSGRVA